MSTGHFTSISDKNCIAEKRVWVVDRDTGQPNGVYGRRHLCLFQVCSLCIFILARHHHSRKVDSERFCAFFLLEHPGRCSLDLR